MIIKKSILYSLFSIFFILSFLNAEHYLPWTSFDSEVYVFYAIFCIFMIFFFSSPQKNKNFYFKFFIIFPLTNILISL